MHRCWHILVNVSLLAGSVILLAGNLAPLGARWFKWSDQACHFKMQSLLAAVVLFALVVWLRRGWRVPRVTILAVIVVNLWQVAPWLPWGSSGNASSSQPTIQVTLFNVLHRNRQFDDVVDYLASQPSDLLVLLEVNELWFKACERLRDRGYPYLARNRALSTPGTVILSRHPIRSVEERAFSPEGSPDLKLVIEFGNQTITVYGSHPRSPMNQKRWNLRNGHLAKLAAELAQTPGPVLVAADLNCTMWSPFYEDLAQAGLENARHGHGLAPTWPAPYARVSGIPIDHVLFSRHFECELCETGPSLGSDHLPITARLRLSADSAAHQIVAAGDDFAQKISPR